jgi:hypothetical protein
MMMHGSSSSSNQLVCWRRRSAVFFFFFFFFFFWLASTDFCGLGTKPALQIFVAVTDDLEDDLLRLPFCTILGFGFLRCFVSHLWKLWRKSPSPKDGDLVGDSFLAMYITWGSIDCQWEKLGW